MTLDDWYALIEKSLPAWEDRPVFADWLEDEREFARAAGQRLQVARRWSPWQESPTGYLTMCRYGWACDGGAGQTYELPLDLFSRLAVWSVAGSMGTPLFADNARRAGAIVATGGRKRLVVSVVYPTLSLAEYALAKAVAERDAVEVEMMPPPKPAN